MVYCISMSINNIVCYIGICVLVGCSTKKQIKPTDTELKQDARNWVITYQHEMRVALDNEDIVSYFFFKKELENELLRLQEISKYKGEP